MICPMLTIRWRPRPELNCKKHTGRDQQPKEAHKEEQCLMMCTCFPFLPMLKLIQLAKMAGVMHEADHASSTQSTWWMHRLATDVPFIAYVVNLPCTFTHYLKLSNFQF